MANETRFTASQIGEKTITESHLVDNPELSANLSLIGRLNSKNGASILSYIDINNGVTIKSNDPGTITIEALKKTDTDTDLKIFLKGNTKISGNLEIEGVMNYSGGVVSQIQDQAVMLCSSLIITDNPASYAGLEVNRGKYANATLYWNETNNFWEITNPADNTTVPTARRIIDINYGDSRYLNTAGDTATGILKMSGTVQLQFSDAMNNISRTATELSIVADTTGKLFTYNATANTEILKWSSTGIDVTGTINVQNNSMATESVTFGGGAGSGLKLSNSYGYVTVTPLNTGWAHFYTDRSSFIFNKQLYVIGGNVSSYNTDNLYLQTNGATRITALNSTGNVGIGTTSPVATLHVFSSTPSGVFKDIHAKTIIDDAEARLQIRSTDSSTYGSQVILSTGAKSWILMSNAVSDANKFHIGYRASTADEDIAASSLKFVTILTDGKVGINQVAPLQALDVNGSIRTSSIYSGAAYIGFLSDGGAALPIKVGSLCATSTYVDTAPVNGIYSQGRVGIGIKTPSDNLHVYGGHALIDGGILKLAYTSGGTQCQIAGYNGTSIWAICGTSTNSSLVIGTSIDWDRQISIDYTPGTSGSLDGILKLGQLQKNATTFTHGVTALYTNGVERIRIDKDGNFGIGTVAPKAPFHVSGANPNIFLSSSAINQKIKLRFLELGDASNAQGGFVIYDGANNIFNIGVHETGDLLETSDINSIAIRRSDGSVSIKGTSFTEAFNVNGNIALTGTVDGVDIAAFKTEYDNNKNNITAKRARYTKILTSQIAQDTSTALTVIDSSWTGSWTASSIVLIIVDGNTNSPGLDYLLGASNTITFYYDVPIGSSIDIIIL